MKPTALTNDQERALRDQVIAADQPGLVLKDFRTLLDLLGPEGVEAGGKYHLLPIKIIEGLDGLLSRPLRLELKRPQIRSHPYIQGLNLLLRATGLARVRRSGAKARLIPDPVMIEQWDRLNPTEQYFQLLEAWLRIGRAEMVGERGSSGGELLWACWQAQAAIPAKGIRLDRNKASTDHVPGFYGNLYILALLDLFGLLGVEHFPRPITPWLPARVNHSSFGGAVFALLDSAHLDLLFGGGPDEQDHEDEASDMPRFGAWQPLFQPYFPEWRRNLEFPRPGRRDGIFIFRVALGRTWRRLAIPADSTLDDMVDLILRSVKFDSDHLYQFHYIDHLGSKVAAGHPFSDEGPWADKITIGSLPLELRQEMDLTYDFGDNWRFKIKLERIEEGDSEIKEPQLLENHGDAPSQYADWDE